MTCQDISCVDHAREMEDLHPCIAVMLTLLSFYHFACVEKWAESSIKGRLTVHYIHAFMSVVLFTVQYKFIRNIIKPSGNGGTNGWSHYAMIVCF